MSTSYNSQEYKAYLESRRWARLREAVLKRDRHMCQGCAGRRATQVHHTTYEHVFNEFMFELISLCSDCHDRVHGRPSAKKKVVSDNRLVAALDVLGEGVRARNRLELVADELTAEQRARVNEWNNAADEEERLARLC